MSKKINGSFWPAAVIKASLYFYVFLMAIFFAFSLSAWLFGFIITRLGGKVEFFLCWLLVFGFVYAFDGFASISAGVDLIAGSSKRLESRELKALAAWLAGFTALTFLTVIGSSFLAESIAIGAVKNAAKIGISAGSIKTASETKTGINAARALNDFIFSPEGTNIRISASLEPNNENFPYFLERKWTPEETLNAGKMISSNAPQIASFRQIINGSDYLQAVTYPLEKAKYADKLNSFGYLFLEEYAKQMAVEIKLDAKTGRTEAAVENLACMTKLFELLGDDESGLVSKTAAIKVRTVLASAFAAALQDNAVYKAAKPYMDDMIAKTRDSLVNLALKEEAGVIIEKYILIKRDRALIKTLTGLSGPMVWLSTVTGALDISFYRLISDMTEDSDEINIRKYTDVNAMPDWPYLFVKNLEPDIITIFREDTVSRAYIKALYVLGLVKGNAVRSGKLPKSMQEELKHMPESGIKDPFGNGSYFLIVYKGDYMELYSIGDDRIDNSGSIADGKDIGHLLVVK